MTTGWTTPGGPAPDDHDPAVPDHYPAAPDHYPAAPDPTPGWTNAPPRPAWGDFSAPAGPPRPGIVPLRPLTVGELLDGAFTTIRRYPAATLGMAASVMLLVTGVQVVASYLLLNGVTNVSASGTVSGDFFARSSTVDLVVQLVTLLLGTILTGTITAVIGQAVLGRPMGARQAWQAVKPRLLTLLGVALTLFLASLLILVVGVGPGLLIAAAGADGAGIAVSVIGGLVAIVGLIWVVVTFTLASPAAMLEKQGVRNSFRRSRRLVEGSWWRVFGIILLAGILSAIVDGILVVPFTLLAYGTTGFGGTGYTVHLSSLLLVGIGNFLAGTIVRPFAAGIGALLYIDRRMRSEALDLTLQQAAANGG
ncbi:MAG TPA: hypothetical protein VHW92_11895, partial [Mycobacteriales bacterium]|nr:hypothetical protein [Mycobacteriales bacterium]